MQQDLEVKKLKKNIGEKIKFFRKKMGYSQAQLAEKVGIEMKSLSRIESGHNYPQCENIAAIAKALNVQVWQLHYIEEKENYEQMKTELTNKINDNDKILLSLYQYLKLIS